MSVQVEQNDMTYKAQYYIDENQVIVIGTRGEEHVDIHGMTAEQAAKTGLRNLIRKNLIEPIEQT